MGESVTFGNWLRQRRKALDLTQEVLADRVGCALETIRKIESGTRRPSREMVDALAQGLDVPPEERSALVKLARIGIDAPADGAVPVYSDQVVSPRHSTALPGNLPRPLTTFVGRHKEIDLLGSLLRREDLRLLTLTGAGGSGKTRLAVQVAGEVQHQFGGGVFFVSLATITDPQLVMPAIARTLGVREMAGHSQTESIKRYLSDKQMLVLLDNFEQVLIAAPLVTELLSETAYLKIMVTSREPLHLYGEHIFPVLPLHLPGSAPSGSAPRSQNERNQSLEALYNCEAVNLFVQRAMLVQPRFVLTHGNAVAVTEMCQRLDGLPLAIELAAAHLNTLTPQAMLAHMGDRLSLLTRGPRDLPARQQTLRSTMQWSYSLLSAEDGRLFRRLAVFLGGWTLEAAQAVCGAEAEEARDAAGEAPRNAQADMLEGLASLMDKNLVTQAEDLGGESEHGEPRFLMLETIHQYAREKLLESGEADTLRRKHALYFMTLAEEAEPYLRGSRQVEWLDRVEAEHDNFRAALDWARKESLESAADTESAEAALRSDEAEVQPLQPIDIGLRLVGALWSPWRMRSRYTEGRQLVRSILNLEATKGGTAARERARAKALFGEAMLANRQEDNQTAQARAEEALAIYRELGDKQGIATTLTLLVVYVHGEEQLSLLEESRALFEDAGDKWGLARVLYQFGRVPYVQGDFHSAQHFLLQCLALAEQVGDPSLSILPLMDIGNTYTALGDYDTASQYWERSLARCRQVKDRWATAVALVNLVNIAWMQGDATSMRPLAEEALFISREVGNVLHTALSLLYLGRMALIEGDVAGARSLVEESLSVLRQRNANRYGEAALLRFLGHIAKREGDAGKAAGFYIESLTLQDREGYKLWDEERGVASALAAVAALGDGIPTQAHEHMPEQEQQRAARLLGAAQALIDASGHQLDYDERIEYERNLVAARTRTVADPCQEIAWLPALQEGRAMSMEQAIKYALEGMPES